MASITFDSTELVNSTYIPRFIKHESAPIRELHLLDLAKEDGTILVSEKYGVKHIVIIGKLTAASRSALDTAIDSFKELFSRKEKDLDIEWEAGTRRYVATCIRHNFDRDHFHNLFVPWSAEFIVVKGVGVSTASEQMYNGTITSDIGGGTAIASKGSAKPKPDSINLNFITGVTGKEKRGIAFICGSKKLIYTQSSVFVDGNQLNINVRDKIVKKYIGASWAETSFHGEFPFFELGNNSFSIEFGEIGIECGDWTQGGTGQSIYGNNWRAQSFSIPWKDESIKCITVALSKTGNPPNNVEIRIETDTGGKPSGTLAHANATISTAPGSLPGAPYRKFFFTNPVTLEANTKYWIVVKTTGGDASNYYSWTKNTDYYIRGNASASVDAGVNWTDDPDNDYVFEIYVGGKRTSNSSVATVISHYPRYL